MEKCANGAASDEAATIPIEHDWTADLLMTVWRVLCSCRSSTFREVDFPRGMTRTAKNPGEEPLAAQP